MKRILVLSLALIFAISSLAVPSYAATSENSSVVNFLTAVDYQLYEKGSYSNTLTTPYVYVWRPGTITWEWPIYNTQYIDRLVFNIVSDVVPDSVQFSINNTNWTTLHYVSSNGKNHQYIMFNAGAVTGNFYLKVNYPSTFDGYTGISSVYGIVSDSIEISSLSYFSNAICRDVAWDEWGQPLVGFNDPVSVGSGSNVALPIVESWYGPSPSDDYVLDHGEFFGKVSFSDTLRYVDSASIVIYSCGEISSYGARLESSDGSIYSGLESSLTYCGETQMLFELRENFERLHMYILTVDLVGFDLNGKILSFNVDIDSVFSSMVIGYDYGFYIQIDSISLSPMTEEVPWYSIFAAWLARQYTVIRNSISSAKDSIVSVLTSGFDRLAELLESGDSQQMQNDVQNQVDEFENMQGVIDSVTVPNVDNIDTDISHVVSEGQILAVSGIYGSIFGVSFIADFVTLSAILGLASFLIYGKKG